MSKKTRKKSNAVSPAKGARAAAKKPAKKPLGTARPASAAKSAKTAAKGTNRATAKKAAAKKAVKKAAQPSANKPAKKSATKSDKTLAKTPAKQATAKPVEKPAEAPSRTTRNAAGQAAIAPPPAKTARKAALEKPPVTEAESAAPDLAIAPAAEHVSPPAVAAEAVAEIPAAAPEPRETVAIEGGLAPEFSLPRDGGGQVSLADYAGQKLVIFFYPRADTPGCTREAIDFTRLKPDFAAAGTAVLGVSADPIKTQEAFRNKHQLLVPLVSDETHAMLQAYRAWGEKSMYGRTFQGVLRTTVLIDGDGRVAKIWHGVKVDGHADAVLAAAREL